MFKRVLLCYDSTEAGRRALRRGAELAERVKCCIFVAVNSSDEPVSVSK
ncbi:MAG TPA: hypothetical protein VK523_12295 [Steroidobacteraceae bacterium]|nr:hypothetical protein [Steroidobacteraceae bacterium]